MTNDRSPITLWFHDAARPFVSQRILADVAEALQEHKAVTVAVPVTDTIYKVKGLQVTGCRLQVESIPSRAEYMRAQTPQAFHADLIRAALTQAFEQKLAITDDCSAVEAIGLPIASVDGDEENIKITTSIDVVIAEEIIRRREA
jgi:2-C-methyl-D-erythritol 4-phosphate cytidylyltransferase